jgi:hypothetical protein
MAAVAPCVTQGTDRAEEPTRSCIERSRIDESARHPQANGNGRPLCASVPGRNTRANWKASAAAQWASWQSETLELMQERNCCASGCRGCPSTLAARVAGGPVQALWGSERPGKARRLGALSGPGLGFWRHAPPPSHPYVVCQTIRVSHRNPCRGEIPNGMAVMAQASQSGRTVRHRRESRRTGQMRQTLALRESKSPSLSVVPRSTSPLSRTANHRPGWGTVARPAGGSS